MRPRIRTWADLRRDLEIELGEFLTSDFSTLPGVAAPLCQLCQLQSDLLDDADQESVHIVAQAGADLHVLAVAGDGHGTRLCQ